MGGFQIGLALIMGISPKMDGDSATVLVLLHTNVMN